MRVLVCDDDAASRFTAKRLLTRVLGCSIVECEDGVQALELLETDRFDLALIDLELPRLGGVEVVEAIRDSPDHGGMRIVVLSQERSEAVVRRLVTLQVDAYLLKPLREQTVVSRVVPLAVRDGANVATERGDKGSLRLSPDSPALLVDGDQNFRHFFTSVASRYGPVVEARSGANALSLFRQNPFQVVFVGADLGVLGASTLIRKIQEDRATHPTRFVGIVDGTEAPDVQGVAFDDILTRVFVPDKLYKALRPLARVPGPLTALEKLAPHFRSCLTSAVTQVMGMMSGLDAAASDDADDGPPPPGISALVNIDVNGRLRLAVELRMPLSLAQALSARMFGCEPGSLTDDTCMSTCGELANMITGRLDCWLKERSLTSHCSLPQLALSGPEAYAAPPEEEGFAMRFVVPEVAAAFLLSFRAQDQLAQYQ